MVQKKVTQKIKAKTAPASNSKSLKTTKPKSVPLTNGCSSDGKLLRAQKKKIATESSNLESISTVENSTEVSSINNIAETSTDVTSIDKIAKNISKKSTKIAKKNPVSSNLVQETDKAGPSKENGKTQTLTVENLGEISDNDKPSTSTNTVPALNTESASKNPKSRKRKVLADEEVKPDKLTLSKNKTKAKKQKIQLEVPSLKLVPGKVFVVGDNDVGQLGLDEDVLYKKKPFLLDLPHSIVDVAAGGMHSVCLTEKGEVLTFGCNDEGALGRVTKSDEEIRIPRKVDIPEKVVKISCGDSHSAALGESGQVYLWGNFRDSAGSMGLTPAGVNSIAPIRVLTSVKVVKIASGEDHLVCLSDEGIVYTCGCGELGQLGRINSRTASNSGGRRGLNAFLEPAAVDRLVSKIPVDDVWTENSATFIKAQKNGSIYAFGLNNFHQLGLPNLNVQNENDKQVKFFPEPITSFNSKKWQQIIGGQHHTLALDCNGLVHSLGRKDYGRLGLGENCEDASVPTVISALENEKCNSVACGNCVSYAVTEHGSLYSWGMGSSQLGQGKDDEDIHSPHLVKGELLNSWEVYKVAGGGQHALILACPKKGNKRKEES